MTDEVFDNTLFGFDKNRLLQTAEILVVAFMILLILLLVVQPMIGRFLTADKDPSDPNTEGDIETALLSGGNVTAAIAGPDGTMGTIGPDGEFQPLMLEEGEALEDAGEMINMDSVQGKVKASSLKKIENIIENYPSETVSVIRSWMTED